MLSISDVVVTGHYTQTAMGGFLFENMFIIMTAIYAVFAFALLLNARDIRKYLSGIDRKTLIILLLIFLAGFLLRNIEYSFAHGFDSMHYPETARTWMATGLFMKGCAVGEISDCGFYLDVLFPAGFPYLIALLYTTFGVNTLNVMVMNGMIGSMSILVVFVIARKLFRKDSIALYSSLVFSLVPIDILIAPTTAVRTSSLFMIGLTIMFFLMAIDNGRLRNWFLVAMTLSLSIYFRQENSILLVPMFVLFMHRYRKSKREFLLSGRFILPLAILIATQIPVQHWILFMGGHSPPGMSDFSIDYFFMHLPWTASALFFPEWIGQLFSPLASMLFLFSIIFLAKKEKFNALFLWSWFLSFFVLYTSFFYCPTLDCPEYPRYMSALSMPYSILAGLSLHWMQKRFRMKREYLIPAAFILLLLTSGLSMPGGIFRDSRPDVPRTGLQIRAVSVTPPECTVLVNNYMATGSDILEHRRRWIDLDTIGFFDGVYAYNEASNATCLMLIEDDYLGVSDIEGKYGFVSDHLELEPYSNSTGFRIYRAEFRG